MDAICIHTVILDIKEDEGDSIILSPLKFMKKKIKLGLLFVLVIIVIAVLLLFFLKKDTQQEEYYYAVISEDEISSDYSIYLLDSQHLENDMMVYGIGYDSTNKKYSGNIFGYSHETKEKNMLAIGHLENKQVQEFRIANGRIYMLTSDEDSVKGIQVYNQKGEFLHGYEIGSSEGDSEIKCWDIDTEENLIVVDDTNHLNVFQGENGQKKYSLSLKENLVLGLISEDNQFIYLSQDSQGNKKVFMVDYLKQTEAKEVFNNQELSDDILSIYSGGKGKILLNGNMALYELDIKKNKINVIFDWLEVDVNNTYTRTIIKEEDDYYVYNVQPQSNLGKLEVIQIAKKYGENPIKVVEIAAIYADQDIKKSIVDFNKSHSNIKVRLNTYGTESDSEIRFNRMLNDLNSNQKIDIIMTGTDRFEILAEKGLLEELDSYMQTSGLADKLITSVINAYKIEGKSYVIPDRFCVDTVLGRKSLFAEERTYTLKEVLDIAKNNENPLYCENAQNDILFNFFVLNDSTERVQSILNNEFEDIILCVQKAPAEYAPYDKDALLEKVVLDQKFYMDFALFRAGHNEEFSIVGYPCEEQCETGAMFETEYLYAISTKSENKDEAWQFIQALLEDEKQKEISNDFPIKKEIFEEKLYDCMDRTGKEPKVMVLAGDTQIEASLEVIDIADVERMKQLVYSTNQYYKMDKTLYNIITEETGAYYAGQKKLEDVIEIIQNRISTYFEEKGM